MIIARTTANFKPVKAFVAAIKADLTEGGRGLVSEALDDWLNLYRRFLRRRYDTYSQGGGDWAELAPSTIAAKARRKRPQRRSATGKFLPSGTYILRDTDATFLALAAVQGGGPGWIERHVHMGVEAGYGGAVEHPAGNGLLIADVAGFAQYGSKNRPAREIVVPPDSETRTKMLDVMNDKLSLLSAATGCS